jgi:hypothetical protein
VLVYILSCCLKAETEEHKAHEQEVCACAMRHGQMFCVFFDVSHVSFWDSLATVRGRNPAPARRTSSSREMKRETERRQD